MFRNVPACSGMFHVPDFIDALSGKFMYLLPTSHPSEDARMARFRAEKRSAQASAHPLLQAQGGLFCVFTLFVCCWSSE